MNVERDDPSNFSLNERDMLRSISPLEAGVSRFIISHLFPFIPISIRCKSLGSNNYTFSAIGKFYAEKIILQFQPVLIFSAVLASFTLPAFPLQ